MFVARGVIILGTLQYDYSGRTASYLFLPVLLSTRKSLAFHRRTSHVTSQEQVAMDGMLPH